MMTSLRIGATLVGAALLTATKGYDAVPLGTVVQPPASLPTTDLTVKPGDIVLRQAIVTRMEARLAGPLNLEIAGEKTSVPADAVLTPVTVAGDAVKSLSPVGGVYCAAPHASMGSTATKAVVGAIGFGLLSGLQRTRIGSRFCLVDGDGDGRVEQAILAGAKRKADLLPVPVTPTEVRLAEFVPVAGDRPSEVSLRYLGPVGMVGNVGFEVDVHEGGRKLALAQARGVASPRKLPRQMVLDGGARLTILSYDAATKAARIRVDQPFDVGKTRFTPQPQTIYVYVPG